MTVNTYPFEGKTVLVTGGGAGIGRAIVRAFLDNGANVAISGRRAEPLAETLAGYPDDRTLAVVNDIATTNRVSDLVRSVVDQFGRLDVVSNAAAYPAGEITDISE